MKYRTINAVTPAAYNSRRSRIRNFLKRAGSCWQLYLLLTPAFLYILIFAYQPMYGLQIAFKDFRSNLGIAGSEWVGFTHFIRFVTFPNFWLYIRNTLLISLYSICTFPCSIILALAINELQNRAFKRTVQMITYAPYFISTVVLCGMIMVFFDKDAGIVNSFIKMFGGAPVAFMNKSEYFRSIYVLSGVWQTVGWGTIIYLAALSGVSPELIEAARIDGANRIHVIKHINLPTIAPTITILFIMNFGSILSVGFEKIYLLQNPLNLSVSQVLSTYVYEVGLVSAQYSYSSAIGLFNTVINLLLLIIVNIVVKRVTSVSLW